MKITSDPAIAEVLQSQTASTKTKAAFAVAAKQLDAQRSQGNALLSLVQNAAKAQTQIASGHLDVRV